jgi:ABC-type branched-subunit amino acid transport system substrate-binding protein
MEWRCKVAKKSLSILLVACTVVLVLATLLSMCTCSSSSGEKTSIKVGVAATITGDIAPYWAPCWQVGKIAFDVINEDPPLGRPLEAIVTDEESSPDGGVKAANYLGGQNVAFEIGYCSNSLLAALDVIERFGIPTFTQWAGSTTLDQTPQGKERLFFRCNPSDSGRGPLHGLYWEEVLAPEGYKTVAILSSTDEASKSSMQGARTALEKAGAQVVYYTEFPPDQATFTRILDEAFAAKPDLIYLGCPVEVGAIVLHEWWNSNLSKDVFWDVPEEWNNPEALAAVTPAPGALDNKLITVGEADIPESNQAYQAMISAYENVYGVGARPDNPYGWDFWDCLNIAALAIVKAGEATPAAISQNIVDVANPPGVAVYSYAEGKKALEQGEEINYEGAGSPDDFDEYGNVLAPLTVILDVDGQWQIVKTYTAEQQAAFINR